MLNTNLIHNVLNVVIAVLGSVTAIFMALGCTASVTGALDCSTSTLVPPDWLPWLVAASGALGVVKLIMNAVRDGLAGMAKPQPPVADQVKTVVVATPSNTNVSVTKEP